MSNLLMLPTPTNAEIRFAEVVTELELDLIARALAMPSLPVDLPNVPREAFDHLIMAEIWARIVVMHRRGATEIDVVQLHAALPEDEDYRKLGGLDYLRRLQATGYRVNPVPLESLAHAVKAQAAKRQLQSLGRRLAELALDGTMTAAEALFQVDRDLEQLRCGDVVTATSVRTLTMRLAEELQQPSTAVSTGLPSLDRVLAGGLWRKKVYGVAARMKVGKAQPVSTPILMQDGSWRPIGDLRLGDKLASIDGVQSLVAGIFPQGKRPVHRVRFSDGRSTLADTFHLWEVRTYDTGLGQPGPPKVVSTIELKRLCGQSRPVWIPRVSGHFGHYDELPVEPYLLGALIGDGCLKNTSCRFSTADPELLVAVNATLPAGMLAVKAGGYDYRLTVVGNHSRPGVKGMDPNPLIRRLTALGLWGCGAHEKFLPQQYLQAGHFARLELLRGLLDTDGSACKGGASLTTVSYQLALDVQSLARSLGMLATCIQRAQTHHTYKGVRKPGRPAWRVNIRTSDPSVLFHLPRKKAQVIGTRVNDARLRVVSVEAEGEEECVCIAVSHPSRLYVANDYIVTHNTVWLATIARNVARSGHKAAYIALEMGQAEVAQRLIADAIGCNAIHFLRRDGVDDLTERLVRYSTQGWAELENLLFMDAPSCTFDRLKELCTAAVRQHKVRVIAIDYWQIITGIGRGETEAKFLGDVAQWLAGFVRLHDVTVIIAAQINRDGQTRGGDGLRLAADWYAHMHECQTGQEGDRWLEVLDSRYTMRTNIGSESVAGLYIDTVGPVFRDMEGECP